MKFANHENICKGNYTIAGNKISFETKCDEGIIKYDGEITDSCLHLNVKSYINGNTSTKRYYFIKDE